VKTTFNSDSKKRETVDLFFSDTIIIIIIIIIFISQLPERPQKPVELATIKQENSRKKTFGIFWFFLGRLPKVDLIILEGKNVRPPVRPYVRPSVQKKFLRFQ